MTLKTASGLPPNGAIDAFLKNLVNEGPKLLFKQANQFKDVLREQLSTPGKGRLYKRGGGQRFSKTLRQGRKRVLLGRPTIFHRASAPGDSPAADTGYLRASVFVKRLSPLRFRIGVSAQSAIALEEGSARMAARPFMEPAKKKWRDQIQQQFGSR